MAFEIEPMDGKTKFFRWTFLEHIIGSFDNSSGIEIDKYYQNWDIGGFRGSLKKNSRQDLEYCFFKYKVSIKM